MSIPLIVTSIVSLIPDPSAAVAFTVTFPFDFGVNSPVLVSIVALPVLLSTDHITAPLVASFGNTVYP